MGADGGLTSGGAAACDAEQAIGQAPAVGKLEDDKPPVMQSASQRVYALRELEAATGRWPRAAFLFFATIGLPTMLAEPSVFAVVWWAGGIGLNVIAALGSLYATYHMASIFHYKGKRRITYREMAGAVLEDHVGPWAKNAIAIAQYCVNIGAFITNMVLSASFLLGSYQAYASGGPMDSLTKWIVVVGAASLCVNMAPDMSRMDGECVLSSLCMIFYAIVAIVITAIAGAHNPPASYAVLGTPATRWFNGLNAIGNVLFFYGDTVLPDIQATLADHPRTGNTLRPMMIGAVIAHCGFVPLYLVIGILGYWAYGNTVSPYLLTSESRPRWLVACAAVTAVFQLLVASQVYGIPVFEATELRIARSFPRCRWMRRPAQGPDGRPAEQPSWILLLLNRTCYHICITFIAAAIPFFSSIMGLVGAAGFGPLTFVLPTVLFLMVYGKTLPRWHYCFDVCFAAVFAVACLLAVVGAARSIIVTASTWQFFS